MKARIGIRRLGLRRNLLLVWNRMILRIVYQCLGSSWYVVVRWGWVVVVARIVPLRREVLRVLSLRWVRVEELMDARCCDVMTFVWDSDTRSLCHALIHP